MQKKLESDLISLAHSILQLKNKDDVSVLHKKAFEVYEKLSVLKFINYYFETTPTAQESEEEIIEKVTRVWVKNEKDELEPASTKKEDELFEEKSQMTLFEKKEALQIEKEEENESDEQEEATILINDNNADEISKKEITNLIKIPLNDRIEIVKKLFEGNQSDFNRVLSQLNSFNDEKEAKNFISRMVKPDYDWSKAEETEKTLMKYITEKFQ